MQFEISLLLKPEHLLRFWNLINSAKLTVRLRYCSYFWLETTRPVASNTAK